jgi:hypothetical protein
MGVTLRVELFITIFCSYLTKGFPLQSLTQKRNITLLLFQLNL